ncbi:MAG: winged helix-turn-helix domain-containing protein [Rhodanobacteraceae bacterium]|nr:winged helix-turn-helix domain-containing protein [Rhodanobacteraceae bacterium]
MQLPTDRIRTLATRSRFRIGGAQVQPDRLTITLDGKDILVEPRTMEVLVALAEHAGEVVTAEQILIEVWRGTFYGDNPVHKAIANLRKVLGDDLKSPRYIETIRRRGYRLVAKVSYPEDYRRTTAQADLWRHDSPYVGLAAFDSRHAEVFFGRSRATAELLAAMRRQIDNQRRFILIVGASGCGKSSLLNAGAIPLLCQDGGFDGMRALAVASCDLAGAEAVGVLPHLAGALSSWVLGGRPVFPPQPVSDLAECLRRSPESVTTTIDEAFARLLPRDLLEQPHAHLLLTIDHAEALVASSTRRDEDGQAFSSVLHHLCESPRVMVAMIVRSDFYLRLIETYPEIAARKLGEGHYDVLTPLAGEIAQIIRIPASLAGLTFEEDPHSAEHLDDVLRDAATEHTDALPLLQHTLQALYERRSEEGMLTFDAYRSVGGLEGALAHRAEEVFGDLGAAVQDSLGLVFSKLIVMQQDTDAVSARRIPWQALNEPSRALAEAFVKARLFAADLSDGEAGFRVAHEALLRQWPRARDWIHDNRQLLQAKARMQRAARRWGEEGRSADHLLNSGRPLHEAREAARALPGDLSADELAFIRASERQHQHRRRLRTAGIVALAVSAIVSAIFAVVASQARREAERRREEALQLSDFMLVDLAEKLRPLGNLKLLGSISEKALNLFDAQPRSSMGVDDLLNRSRALRTAGEVLLEQARHKEAESAFRNAEQAAAAAIALSPQSSDAILEQGTVAFWLGSHHYQQRQLDEARTYFLVYLKNSEELVRRDGDNKSWRLELGYALNNLGTLAMKTGETGQAIDYFQRAAALKEALHQENPGDSALEYGLINSLSWISTAQEANGDLIAAAQGQETQISMLRRLVQASPDNRAWERRLTNFLHLAAQTRLNLGRTGDAAQLIDESAARLAKIVQLEPDNRVWQRDYAHALMQSADILQFSGAQAKSLAKLRLALELSASLVAATAVQPEWRRLDALIRAKTAAREQNAEKMDAAVADFLRLSEQAPDDTAGRPALAQVLLLRGEMRLSAGQVDLAREDGARAIDVLSPVLRNYRDPAVLAPFVAAHVLTGNLQAVEAQIIYLRGIGYRHPDFEQRVRP